MRRGFIKQVASAKELQQIIGGFANANVEADAILIAPSFEDIYRSLQKGDVIVVQNYASISTLGSINNFFDTINEIVAKGVEMESLEEPNVPINNKTVLIFQMVYELSYELRKTKTMQGLNKARAEGKILGRPMGTKKLMEKVKKVDKLREIDGMSVTKACQIVGCLPRTYYRMKKEEMPKN